MALEMYKVRREFGEEEPAGSSLHELQFPPRQEIEYQGHDIEYSYEYQ